MQVKKIELENFRGFLKEEVVFDEKLNVFIGSNASGKTTLLLGILKNLYVIFDRYAGHLNPETREFLKVKESDINYSKGFYQIYLEIKKEELLIPLYTSCGDLPDELKVLHQTEGRKFAQFTKAFGNEIKGKIESVPIVKFYPADRGAIHNKKINTSINLQNPQWETWANIYQDELSYSKFFKWFFDKETQELRLQRDNKDFSIEQPEIKFVRFAVEKALEILYHKKFKIKSDQISRNGSNELIPILRVAEEGIEGSGEELDTKSDGEKAIITLIADIAYNLAIANNFEFQENYLESPGIVMIDEIEAHLHPNWQRAILPLLRELFPNIQFFVTTHSPQVIASVSSEHVFVCEDFQVHKVAFKSKGVDSNTLLKHIFNATERPQQFVDLLERFDQLIDESADFRELEEIISQIKSLEAEDKGVDISPLIEELQINLEAYKFDLAHEANP